MEDRRWPACFVFLLLWARYVRSAAPSLMPGDSAELAAAASSLGVGHSPGYPLFALLGKIFTLLLPWGNEALRMNLFSGFALALGIACLVFAWTSSGRTMSWMPLVLCGLAPLTVTLASSAEVFGLNVLFAALLFLSIERFWGETQPRRFLLLMVFVWALGLGNQQTLLLLAPALAWIVFQRRNLLNSKIVAAAAALVLLGFSVYVYLYLRSRAAPLLNWEEPGTWDRFWKVVSRARYGSLQLAQGTPTPRSFSSLLIQTEFFASRLLHNIGWAGAGLLLAGIAAGLGRSVRNKTIFYGAALLISGPLFLFWANVSPTVKTVEMLDRFLLLPLVIGFYFIVRGWETLLSGRSWSRYVAAALVVLWVWPLARVGAFGITERRNFITLDHGENALRTLPPSALLIADRADETEFALCHLLVVENARPDAEFVDANAGVTTSRYGADYYGIWGKPRLARRQAAETAWISVSARPVYYASLDLKQLDIPRRPVGFLFAAKETQTRRMEFPFWRTLVFRNEESSSVRDGHLLLTDADLLGQYAMQLRDEDAAKRFLVRAERYGAAPWRLRMALWFQSNGRLREAEALYRQLLQRPGKAPLVWTDLGVLYADEGRVDEALECYRRAVQDDPSYAEAYYNMGVIYWRKGDWAAVAAAFEKTLQIDPAHDRARRYLDQARRRGGKS